MTGTLIVHDADLGGRRVDVTCAGGLIVAVEPASNHRPGPGSGVEIIDARGGAVLPGLHDHHIHLLAAAAAVSSVQAGPPQVVDADQLIAALRQADRLLPPGEAIRAVGYHESVAGPIDGDWLDALGIARPIRVQHRTGALWILNTAALFELGLGTGAPDLALPGGRPAGPAAGHPPEHVETDANGRPTGRLFRADHRLRGGAGRPPKNGSARHDERERLLVDLAAVGRRLASYGITGVTDLTPTDDPAAIALLAGARRAGALPMGVVVTGSATLPAGASPELPRGPVKIVIDDHELPPFDWVTTEFTRARATGRAIAVHSVTRESLVLALAAWHDVGVVEGDRIEHGAVIPVELIGDIAEVGLTVVTQPSFVHERGDQYLTDVEPADVPHLWRCGSLIDAGIRVAFGSDAPYGDPDPWAAVRTAVDRGTRGGRTLGPGERIHADTALRRFGGTATDPGRQRRVEPDHPADLCVLDRPLVEQLAAPDATAVVATIAAGSVVFER